ncbi:MAG: hypothetical protein ABIO70_01635 [Pseudomonadota bacterium]
MPVPSPGRAATPPAPATIEVPRPGATALRLERMGTTMWGTTYRAPRHPLCVRLVPTAQTTLEERHAIKELAARPIQPRVARVQGADYLRIEGRDFFAIRYEILPDASLTEVIAHPDPVLRAAYAVRALRALPHWRKALGTGLLPMPGDVVFVQDQASFLAVPDLPPPGLQELVEAPERGRHLPPQRVLGLPAVAWKPSADLYALTVSLLDCFFSPAPVRELSELLESVARGEAARTEGRKNRLPFWVDKLPASRASVALLRQALSARPEERTAVDAAELARSIELWKARMDPVVAVSELRARGDLDKAAELLDDALLDRPSHALNMLAAKLAWEDRHRPLEAIDHLERAIELETDGFNACLSQLDLITGAAATPGKSGLAVSLVHLLMVLEGGDTASQKLDDRALRDFGRLPPALQDQRETALARYLLWRDRFDLAARFIYPRLFKNGAYCWWKVELAVGYAEALLGQGEVTGAEAQVKDTRARLPAAIHQRVADPEALRGCGLRLCDLEERLLLARRGGSP